MFLFCVCVATPNIKEWGLLLLHVFLTSVRYKSYLSCCGKPPKKKYKNTSKDIKKQFYFYLFFSIFSYFYFGGLPQFLIPNSR